MALQNSGPISLTDIAAELGISQTNMSLRSMSNLAGFAQPDAISEFYGYTNLASANYANFTRGQAIKKQAVVPQLLLGGIQDITVSMWVKQGATAAAVQNQILFDFAEANNTNNRFFLQYDKNGNRFVLRMRTNSSNFTINYEIEQNNSSMGLGTNSGTRWSTTNRGAVNSDGWCLLTVVYDASQSTPANAFTFYWNNNVVSTGSGAGAGSRTTKNVNFITFGNNNHNPTTTAGGFVGGMDEIKIYTSALSSSNVNDIYNAGVIAPAADTYSTGLLTEMTLETDVSDSGNNYPIVIANSAPITAH